MWVAVRRTPGPSPPVGGPEVPIISDPSSLVNYTVLMHAGVGPITISPGCAYRVGDRVTAATHSVGQYGLVSRCRGRRPCLELPPVREGWQSGGLGMVIRSVSVMRPRRKRRSGPLN